MIQAPHITRSLHGDVAVVAPCGEFDLAWAEPLREELAEVLSRVSTRVVLDLAQTTFLDSSALGAVMVAARAAREAGGWLRLVAPQPNVRQVLALTQIDAVLGLYDT